MSTDEVIALMRGPSADEELGCIASRRFELDNEGVVEVRLKRPRSDGGDFRCDYEISGLGRPVTSHACGVDSMQAVCLALLSIATDLYSSPEWKEGRVRWLGMPDLGFGCPPGNEARGP
ncbi:MAG TPA: hypothetical protein VGS12_16275 [Caulobacteraceae bacterium]|nr:hypothetical protein [Caulobacteraceae bacterium]